MTTCTLKIGLMSEGYPLSQHFAKSCSNLIYLRVSTFKLKTYGKQIYKMKDIGDYHVLYIKTSVIMLFDLSRANRKWLL